jgi:CheY-like chemotaxis protein
VLWKRPSLSLMAQLVSVALVVDPAWALPTPRIVRNMPDVAFAVQALPPRSTVPSIPDDLTAYTDVDIRELVPEKVVGTVGYGGDDGQPILMAADDRPENLVDLQKLLDADITLKDKFKLVTAADGVEMFARFQQLRSEGRPIAGLVTDWNMAPMNGGELIKAIRRIEPNFPIIALSSLGDKNVTNRYGSIAFHYGVGFLERGDQEEKLLAMIEDLSNRHSPLRGPTPAETLQEEAIKPTLTGSVASIDAETAWIEELIEPVSSGGVRPRWLTIVERMLIAGMIVVVALYLWRVYGQSAQDRFPRLPIIDRSISARLAFPVRFAA